jgi:AcrR family transcriptional regulator
MTTTSQTDASTDDRIIDATLRLIAREGLGAVTMSRIAEAANVARQTLYNHYPDIDSIVAEAVGRHHRQGIEMLEASMSVVDDPRDGLEQLVRHVVSVGAHAHHDPGIHHGLSAHTRASLGAYDEALDRQIRAVLEDGRQAGVFRSDLTPEVDAVVIRHMLDGLAALSAATPDDAALLAAAGTRTVLAAVTQR